MASLRNTHAVKRLDLQCLGLRKPRPRCRRARADRPRARIPSDMYQTPTSRSEFRTRVARMACAGEVTPLDCSAMPAEADVINLHLIVNCESVSSSATIINLLGWLNDALTLHHCRRWRSTRWPTQSRKSVFYARARAGSCRRPRASRPLSSSITRNSALFGGVAVGDCKSIIRPVNSSTFENRRGWPSRILKVDSGIKRFHPHLQRRQLGQ